MKRLLALDVLRGLTVGSMILVNSAGNWGQVYAPLRHARWNGLTVADVIFPLFIFMMGVSMYISLGKSSFSFQRALLFRVLRRTCLLFAIGVGIYALSTFLTSFGQTSQQGGEAWKEAFASLAHVRILGVLQRLALCYGVGALLVMTVRHRYLPYLIVAILSLYYVILVVGNGFEYGPENILSQVDRFVLGTHHMYNDRGIDPEGVLSTLPAIAHVLIGFCFGRICMESSDLRNKLNHLFLYGTLCLLAGFVCQELCPLNKKVWTPTFVSVTCGFSALLLAVLLWYIDETKQYKKTRVFEIFGTNPLFCYVFSEILYILADTLPVQGKSFHELIYGGMVAVLGDNSFSSALYAFLFVGIVWAIGNVLYKRRIYIKI